jgi:hypothetical protein
VRRAAAWAPMVPVGSQVPSPGARRTALAFAYAPHRLYMKSHLTPHVISMRSLAPIRRCAIAASAFCFFSKSKPVVAFDASH